MAYQNDSHSYNILFNNIKRPQPVLTIIPSVKLSFYYFLFFYFFNLNSQTQSNLVPGGEMADNDSKMRTFYNTRYPQGLELSGLYPGPYFDLERNHANVSAYLGTHAYLPCFVKQLGNKSVSWIRKSDAHIVTVDRFTFIADERFQVLPQGESWTLQIKYVQPRDAGVYECQISTEPKLAFPVELNVLVPSVRMGTREENMYVWEGSQVQIRCLVQNTPLDNLGKMLWFKNGQHLDKNENPSIFKSKIEGSSIIESLSFKSVQKSDGGNYTCSLEPVGSSTISLHVLNGENPAAMQDGKNGGIASSTSSSKRNLINPFTTLILIFYYFLSLQICQIVSFGATITKKL